MAAPGDRSARAIRLTLWMLGIVLAAPALVFASIVGVRLGVIDYDFGYRTLAVVWGWRLALIGAAAALVAVYAGLRAPRRAGGWALAVVAVSAASLWVGLQAQSGFASGAPGPDVASNRDDPPGFARGLVGTRTAAGASSSRVAGQDDRCDNSGSLPFQASPEAAEVALQRAGFIPLGRGVGRSDGTREGFWFGQTHDAVVRIRPAQTDVRVAAREPGPDGGAACRLLNRIQAELQTMR